MSTTNGYTVTYHYERNGISSHQHDVIHVAAGANDNTTIITAIKNNAQYCAGAGTIVIDSVKSLSPVPLQQ